MLCCASCFSHVRLFATLWTVAPLSMGFSRARILEWVAMPSSKGSSQLRDWTQVSSIAGGFFTIWVTGEAPNQNYLTFNFKRKLMIINTEGAILTNIYVKLPKKTERFLFCFLSLCPTEWQWPLTQSQGKDIIKGFQFQHQLPNTGPTTQGE